MALSVTGNQIREQEHPKIRFRRHQEISAKRFKRLLNLSDVGNVSEVSVKIVGGEIVGAILAKTIDGQVSVSEIDLCLLDTA